MMIRLFSSLLFLVFVSPTSQVSAQQLDVPIFERSEGNLDTCFLGEVAGLKAGGDGFLAVRTGPSTNHRKIDEVYNGDRVWIFDTKDKWLGVIYGIDYVDCSPVAKTRPLNKPGKKGWVHRNWVRPLAG